MSGSPGTGGRKTESRPDPDTLLRELQPPAWRRGALRVYLGYARGCGTTTAMLEEGRRRRARGTDVVVAGLEPRAGDAGHPALADLEVLPDTGLRVLDVDAVLARNPEVACIGSLVNGASDGRPRFDAVERLLEAGVTLIATLHIAELASLRPALERYVHMDPGSVPMDDEALYAADELEMVDITPEKLIERLRDGLILPPAQAAAALQGEFRIPVLTTLRENTFRVVAEHTERRLLRYMRERGIETPWESRARVLLCIAPRPDADSLVRQAARRAAALDGSLTVLSVRAGARSEAQKQRLGGYATLTHELGGEFVTLYGRDAAAVIAEHVRTHLVTEVILGRGPRRPPWKFWERPFTVRLIRRLRDVDVHILRR